MILAAGALTLLMQATVIDTVKIRAAAVEDHGRAEFEKRRRTGAGRYVTGADLARQNLAYTSEAFRSLPGVRVEDKRLVQRGTFSDTCYPVVYVNGFYMSESISIDDLNTMMTPREVAGIEIYSPGTAPAGYQRGLQECGTILFWTKRPNDGTHRRRISRSTVGVAVLTAASMFAISRWLVPN